MSLKRAAETEDLYCEGPVKLLKLTTKHTANNESDFGFTSNGNKIQEPEFAIKEYNSKLLNIAQEVAKTPNSPQYLSITALRICVELNNEEVAFQLLTNQTINIKVPVGNKLLWAALEGGHVEMASLLIRFGADLSVPHVVDGRTVLHEVLRSKKIKTIAKREQLVKLMLDYGADINARDKGSYRKYTVLNDAIKYDHCSYRIVEEILNRGAKKTVNTGYLELDDLYLAVCYKPELLPRLIAHQETDVQKRNRRGSDAILYLIRQKSRMGFGLHVTESTNAVQMIKKILNLGVPVHSSFLHEALQYKNKELIKIFLEYAVDIHQRDNRGQTALYNATAFKGFTYASRWLIEKGASIQACNDDGRYPIHGACENESLKNIHLLINLGADLNCIDNNGFTPMDYMKMKKGVKVNEPQRLVIKHMALNIVKGGCMTAGDLMRIHNVDWCSHHFDKCAGQLEQMQVEMVYRDVSYFSLFRRNIKSMMQLMKNKNFINNFKQDEKRRAELFPDFFYMLLNTFELAEKRLEILMEMKEQLRYAIGLSIPDHIVENIAYHYSYDKLLHCRQEYYLNLHATLKYTNADKAKIL